MSSYLEKARAMRQAAMPVPQDEPASYLERARRMAAVPQQAEEEEAEKPPGAYLRTPDGKQERRFPAGVNTESEYALQDAVGFTASAGTRTTEGALKFLEEKLGRGSVYTDDQGQIFVLTPEERQKPPDQQRPMVLNRKGFSASDVAVGAGWASVGLAGGMLAAPAIAAVGGGAGITGTIAPAMVGATAGAGGVASGGVIGAGLSQAPFLAAAGAGALALGAGTDLGAQLVGKAIADEKLNVADAMFAGGMELIAPGVGRAVGAGARKIASAVNPRTLVERIAYRGLQPDEIAKTVIGAEQAGTQLTVGQIAGRTGLEKFVEATPFAGGPTQAVKETQPAVLKEYAESISDSLGAAVADSSATARAAVGTYTKAVGRLAQRVEGITQALSTKARPEAAKGAVKVWETTLEQMHTDLRQATRPLFGRIKELGGEVQVPRVFAKLDDLQADYVAKTAPDEAEPLLRFFDKIRNELLGVATDPARPGPARLVMDPLDFQNSMSYWGKAAAEKGRHISDKILDPKKKAAIARGMYGAFLEDLGEATAEGEVGQAIKAARDEYAKAIAPIKEFAELPFREFRKNPERLVTMLQNKDSIAKAEAILGALDQHAPVAAADVRAAFMRDVVGDLGEGIPDPMKIGPRLAKKWPQVQAVFAGDPESLKQLAKVRSTAAKLAKNPLRKLVQNPEAIYNLFGDTEVNKAALRDVVRFLRASNPELADRLAGRHMAGLIEAARPTQGAGVDAVVNTGQLMRALERSQGRLNTVLAGNRAARDEVSNLIKVLRVVNRSEPGMSPTYGRQQMMDVIKALAKTGGAIATGTLAFGSTGGVGSVAAGIFGSRMLGKAMANPVVAKSYAELYKASMDPRRLARDPAAGAAARRALGQILTWAARDPDFRDSLSGMAAPELPQ